MQSDEPRLNLGLTMGDPSGVGPELLLRVIVDPEICSLGRLVVFGDYSVLEHCAEHFRVALPNWERCMPSTLSSMPPDPHIFVDLQRLDLANFKPRQVNEDSGDASFQYVDAAIQAALEGEVDSITTCPINKESLHLAGHKYPGHTEILAERASAERWCMMQYSPQICCTFVTVHVGYHEVPELVTTQRILDTIELTVEALRKIRGRDPRLVVCGLNPHAGENGLFGRGEEEMEIGPAVARARAAGIEIEGPLPPDTAFLPWRREVTDAFICMYHDQGHIPLKALAFDEAVNTTLGLKIVRTSVDHGTAFDIAWLPDPGSQAIAQAPYRSPRPSCQSLKNAIKLAAQLGKKS